MSDDLTPESLARQQQAATKQSADHRGKEAESEEEFEITDADAARAMEIFRNEQNLFLGAVYGFAAAIAAAILWAGITVTTQFESAFLAIGAGLLVGLAVRTGGKGIDQVFGVVGAAESLLACALAKLVTQAWLLADQAGVSVVDVLSQLDADLFLELMEGSFEMIDLLFVGVAVFLGYRTAFRELTVDDYKRALGRAM